LPGPHSPTRPLAARERPGARLRAALEPVLGGPCAVAGDVFLRLLALVYAIAFVSLWTQAEGLIGSQGILPAGEFLDLVRERYPGNPYLAFPTLCWLSSTDGFIHFLCGAGTAIALASLVAPYWTPPWILLWALYLSLTVAGQTFLGFQWDILLVEVGFLAVFVSPLALVPAVRAAAPPSLASVWLLRWLLFRFMLASGAVKLMANDPDWWRLGALDYHYFTQPLPPWTAWHMHHLPAWLHRASTGAMFAIELLVPWLVFLRRTRIPAFVALALLQLVIIATGNYTFFNLLTIALCVPLLEDGSWPRPIRRWLLGEGATDATAPPLPPPPPRPPPALRAWLRPRKWPAWLAAPLAAAIIIASLVPLGRAFTLRSERGRSEPLAWLEALPWLRAALLEVEERQRGFHLVNGYGLFADMTTERPEIVVEGSEDGVSWTAYEFRYKPGDLARRPAFVAPHQPRLDWQMWFAALGDWRANPWFVRFIARLLEGSEPVLALLERNPFPERPPRLVRAVFWTYRFTTPEERRASGRWWEREPRGTYFPPVSREMFERAERR
jgi:hypothetical protein